MHRLSLYAYLICAALLAATAVFYYPKWEKKDTEATISWDVSGYYLYLPAAFIYKDMKNLAFFKEIEDKYRPGPNMGQAFKHPKSGNYVMKYSGGQALQYLPWFFAAHALAEPLGYPADGFSKPYQMAIGLGSLLVALLGLWFARRNLLFYFSDKVSAITLLLMVGGSNYLNYAAIDNAMTHNWVFTLYSILIYSTIRFYRNPGKGWALLIGVCMGWAVITRPTELIGALIPLFWGVTDAASLRSRYVFFRENMGKIALAALTFGGMVMLQLAYWKWVSGEWVVYSYQEQGFSWLKPHVLDVLFSYKAGWLTYSPVMCLGVIGLFGLKKTERSIFWAVTAFSLLFLYVTSAWDIWWYGGSLGSRAMVQSHSVWIFPMAVCVQMMLRKNWSRWLLEAVGVLCVVYNLWWTMQAHTGGLFQAEQMTKRYFWKVLGQSELNRDWLKYLDTRDEFTGEQRLNVRQLLQFDFEKDSVGITTDSPISGAKSLIINKDRQFSPEWVLPLKPGEAAWVRGSVSFRSDPKEWDFWRMCQFVVRFYDGDKMVKDRLIRLQRHVDGNEVRSVFFDTKIPNKPFTRAVVYFWNADSDKTVRIDDVVIEAFE